mmetsp:Transcript_17013/g.50778  ORF Transcript_17013/g.50778 Transcript_17013/m.50778 type:complete len:129 (-) Transcript_17013:302-688(-)
MPSPSATLPRAVLAQLLHVESRGACGRCCSRCERRSSQQQQPTRSLPSAAATAADTIHGAPPGAWASRNLGTNALASTSTQGECGQMSRSLKECSDTSTVRKLFKLLVCRSNWSEACQNESDGRQSAC